MTTENVAVLFTDTVGSTALSSSLSAEGADELRREHFSILRQAVAEAGGSEVKNLGDGLMVVFASASAALSCAVAMQQGVERNNRACEQGVGLRVGLSGGEVSREDDDYFGDPVIEAARLCATCEAGQILAADVVRAVAGRRSRHECRSIGGLILKGLPDPVATVEVAWEPIGGADTGTEVPLPGRLGVRPAVGVIGRETETGLIADASKRVMVGEGREVVLVSGEPGLGKTTLVAEIARTAFAAGACVLFGHCEEDLAAPYQLFGEALGHYVTHAPEDQLAAHIATHGSQLVKLVPALASRSPNLPPSKATDSDTERYLLFTAVVGLFSAVSASQPLVLVLDDLQWADKASLMLLRHLIASELPMRVLVVGTYRDSEVSRSHPFVETLAALHRQPRVSRVELTGLDDGGVVALFEAAAGHALEGTAVDLAHAVYRETDGNPFFVTEVLRDLTETGAIAHDANGRWVAQDSLDASVLPASVRVVIGARVGRLGPDAERVLAVAAVIGRDFDLDLLGRATNTSEDGLLDILEAAATVALVREPSDPSGRYNFSHALIQHTLYEDQGPNRKARAHRQVAEALEDLCGDRPGVRVRELARHWSNATQPVDLTRVIRYCRLAGDAALSALAPGDALRYYAQALDLYPRLTDPDPTLGIDLAIGLGTAQRQSGDPTFRETLLDAARRAADLDDTDRLVAAVLANDRGTMASTGRVDADKLEVLEATLSRLPADSPARALVLSILCTEVAVSSTLERRQALADEALAIAEASGDDAIIVRVRNNVFYPLCVPSLLEQSLARSADTVERAERAGDPFLYYFALQWRAHATLQAGDLDEYDRDLDRAETTTEQLNQPFFSWGMALYRCQRAMIAGDPDRAEQFATDALQISTDAGLPDATVIFGAQLTIVSYQRGTLGDFVSLIEQAIADAPDIAPAFKATLALAYVEADNTDDAVRLLDEFASTGYELPVDQVWLAGMVCYAEVAIAVGDATYAGRLYDLIAPWADQFVSSGGVVAYGPVSYYLGGLATLLGRGDEADTHFAQATAMNQRMHAKFFAARNDLLWAKMLTGRDGPGDIDKARALLIGAQTVATTNGYANVERRATQALQPSN